VTSPARRGAAAAVVAVAIAGAVVLDASRDAGSDATNAGSSGADVTAALPLGGLPAAAPERVLSSSFVCPGGPAPSDTAVGDLVVRLLDVTADASSATVTILPNGADAVTLPEISLSPGVTANVRIPDTVTSDWAAVLVDVPGGGVVVEQTSTTATGLTDTPCASVTSDRWWFAEADTTRTRDTQIVLVNPGMAAATVDMDFATADGGRTIEGIFVPPRRVVIVDPSTTFERQEAISMQLVARDGQVVVARVQATTAGGRSISLGVPELANDWWFSDVVAGGGATTAIVVSNPSDAPAVAVVDLRPDDPAALAATGVEILPFRLDIPPESSLRAVLSADRVPPGTYSASVLSESGVGLAVDRLATFDPAQGSDRRGLQIGPGVPAFAPVWASARPVEPGVRDVVSVTNPTATPATVTVATLLPGGDEQPAAEPFTVPPGGSVRLRLDDRPSTAGEPVIVRSTGDVVAERAVARSELAGVSTAPMVPVP
jgi:hypothetical protein